MKYHFSVLILLSLSPLLFGQTQHLSITDLQCEYLENPISVDITNPRFTWKIADNRKGASQYAYRITVGTDSAAVAHGTGNMWDTGKTVSNSTLASYAGNPFTPFTQYYWSVTVWGADNNKSTTSKVASFRTGMMNANWRGSWISDSRDIALKPAALFRKEFNLSKEIKSAHIYIATAGLYELELNGSKVGDHFLDPVYTRFDTRNLYVAHDVTDQLQEQNAISVLLGNGWYNHQSTAVWYFHEAPWRARPRFNLDLRIVYTDSSVETISTDRSWKTALSPVVFNSIYTGEHYNASLEQEGYSLPGFDDSQWKNSIYAQAPSENVSAQQMQPIRVVERISPKSMRKISDTRYIFDLGRNISGVSELSVKGAAQTEIRVTHSELLDAKDELDLSNIIVHYRPTDDTDPFQTDIYTLKGDGMETFSPRFNYKGFQYVEVSSTEPITLTEESLKGLVVHSDVTQIGFINSSSNTLNKIWKATNNSYLSNLMGYPTDCPQREKNGWTGDAHIAVETGLYNFDGITIYEKWLQDHRDEQQPNGVLPSIIPSNGWGYEWGNGPDWTSSIAIIPWNIYLFYGDARILEQTYNNIKSYVDHITDISEGHLTTWGLGDWIPVKTKTPVEYTSSIYYFVDASILAKTARLLGHESDFEKYSTLVENIKSAINKKYFNEETALYGNGAQTELSTALHWGIVPERFTERVAQNLANRVVADNKHIDVGLLGSKAILNALSDNGFADLAYEVAAQETFPSWGWWVANGLTTLPENWNLENKQNDISHNHIMFGEISAWYYKALGGLKPDPQHPGFSNFFLEPNFVQGLDHFEARFNSPQGEITSSWKKGKNHINYHVVVPPNSSCLLTVKAQNLSDNMSEYIVKQEDGLIQLRLVSGTYDMQID